MDGHDHERDPRGCAGCGRGEGTSRRDFLTRASGIVVGGLVAAGLGLREAQAIPVGWIEALDARQDERTYTVPEEDGASIDREGQVIVVRHEGKLYAFALACPHENTALRWRERQQRFQCPQHDSRYQPDGTFIDGRATRNMDRFAVRLSDGKLVVDKTRRYHSDEELEAWQGAVIVLD